jgi:hypothetical protein
MKLCGKDVQKKALARSTITKVEALTAKVMEID